jgi:putative transcriptional regulator
MNTNKPFEKSFFSAVFLIMAFIFLSAGSVFPLSESSFPFDRAAKLVYSGLKPSKGKFLVAGRSMGDPRFRETVILLIRHGSDGAVGLIINRPTKVKLSHAFPEIKVLENRSDTLFLGGPVGADQMFMLARSESEPAESLQVFKGIYVSSDRLMLRSMAEGNNGSTFRVYGGYAGWGAGQLESELSKNDWHVINADAETIFDKEPEKIWPELILRSSAIHVRLNPWLVN